MLRLLCMFIIDWLSCPLLIAGILVQLIQEISNVFSPESSVAARIDTIGIYKNLARIPVSLLAG